MTYSSSFSHKISVAVNFELVKRKTKKKHTILLPIVFVYFSFFMKIEPELEPESTKQLLFFFLKKKEEKYISGILKKF